jgi:hypothetical protein
MAEAENSSEISNAAESVDEHESEAAEHASASAGSEHD